MPDCPDCDKSFDTENKLAGHYGGAHEGGLPKPDNVTLPEDKEWSELSPRQRSYYRNQDKAAEKRKQRREDIREWFYNYKKKLECSKCDEDRPPAIQFHHPNDDKEKRVSELVTKGYGKETILKEIDKCEVLCANCHSVLHAGSQGVHKGYEQS